MGQSTGRGVQDAPLEPVIGLAEGETRSLGMTPVCGAARLLFPPYFFTLLASILMAGSSILVVNAVVTSNGFSMPR